MSYEDSFEREAKDERAYKSFEHGYIYENLRPLTIGRWEWDLMFNRVEFRRNYSEVLRDAKEMAQELGCATRIEVCATPGMYQARPVNYYDSNWPGHSRFESKRHDFIKSLVLAGTYPDLAAIADTMNHPAKFEISRHAFDERDLHNRWRSEAATQTSTNS